MSKLRTMQGDLTDYGLSCGYCNSHRSIGGNLVLCFYKERNTYHVRFINYMENENIWFSYDKLTLARSSYKNYLKKFESLYLNDNELSAFAVNAIGRSI
jgi:hypothetical protein